MSAYKRSALDLLVTSATLKQVQYFQGQTDFTDLILENGGIPENIIKNVCAKVSVDLSDRIDNIVNVLGISKRRFLEAAFIEACDAADLIIAEEGLEEAMEAKNVMKEAK